MTDHNMTPHPSFDTDILRERTQRQSRAIAEQYDTGCEGQRLPTHVIMEEAPVHTNIAYLMVAGRTRKEIAQITGWSLPMLSQLTKQPWFTKRLKEITDAAGKDMVKAFLEGQVLPSLETLVTIRDDVDEKGATRVTAANSILDRFMGKPVAHIESKTNLNIHTAADAAEQIQSELEKVDAELQAAGVKISRSN